jgi:hypothetical protein
LPGSLQDQVIVGEPFPEYILAFFNFESPSMRIWLFVLAFQWINDFKIEYVLFSSVLNYHIQLAFEVDPKLKERCSKSANLRVSKPNR